MASQRFFRFLVSDDEADAASVSPEARPHIAANGIRQMAAQTLQSVGDQVVNAKTVLPWLVTALGAPSGFVGLLVPIREAGSMLPQAAWAPRIRRRRVRKWVWVAGAAGQAGATAAMALVAATASGTVAGVGVLAALAVFALARSLSSIASKDVLGRTVPKGQRGQIKGATTVASAAVALSLGVALRTWGGESVGTGVLAALLGAAALAWVGAAAVYATIREPAAEVAQADADGPGWVSQAVQLWREDAVFRKFVFARALLLVTALSPPFVVTLGVQQGSGLSALGLFVIAQGVAGLVGGRVFGRLADRSSRRLMIGASLAASAVIVAHLGLVRLPGMGEAVWLAAAAYLLLALVHVGARLARKTYVVDIAEGDRRTQYVAVANTLMGVLLLAVGAGTAALAVLGAEFALLLLAVLGVAGAVVGRSLPEVEKG
ncbi:MFS transporter [Demequina muriae]|uniref:MFS transporter n=1 Tax=Demequina muriae TaxID=3051664 RepID=A0ABT8GE40_9MICO|nr:MFS transporter [Demequina sp. EGI L300058]MDN4479696.1 MFS transporter [Demequina sp. EGI L300058]